MTNGSFETYTGGHSGPSQLGNSGTGGYTALTGWDVGAGSTSGSTYGFLMAPGVADTTGAYSPRFSNTFTVWGTNNGGPDALPNSSPDGGNYLVLDGGESYRGTGISQTLTGLITGSKYDVSFYWAAGQQQGFTGAAAEQVQVSLRAETHSTAVVRQPGRGFSVLVLEGDVHLHGDRRE